MLECTRGETDLFMSGRAHGVVRKYDGTCPHQMGDKIQIGSRHLGNGNLTAFAVAQITSIRPGTVGSFEEDPIVAEMDGYPNPSVWRGQMQALYRGISSSDRVHHLSLRILTMDKDAGKETVRPESVDYQIND